MTDIDYAERVQRGIALLDEKWPAWATEIDLETLDIKSGYHCMTAQYAEHSTGDPDLIWEDGMDLLGLSSSGYEEHGFNAAGAMSDEDAPIDHSGYDTLNGLWKAEIERRRAQGQDAPAGPGA
jgi:hypothetical protein